MTCVVVYLEENLPDAEHGPPSDDSKECDGLKLYLIKHGALKGNSGIFKPRPYFWHELRSSTHREQFGESRRPSEDI